MKIDLSKEDVDLLIVSLDAVVRGSGIEAARQLLPLADKLQKNVGTSAAD